MTQTKTTGIYEQMCRYSLLADGAKRATEDHAKESLMREIERNMGSRLYSTQSFYQPLSSFREEQEIRIKAFRLGYLVTVPREEAHWHELVAFKEISSLSSQVEVIVPLDEPLTLDGMEGFLKSVAPTEIRRFDLRCFEQKFLSLKAWERVE